MNITFIRPNMTDRQSSDVIEPLVFAILQALTPKNIQISFFDERIEALPLNDTPDLVALTVETFTARRAYQIADHYRRQGIPVVMGGHHPSLLPAEVAHFADSVVIGDAERLWPQILDDARSGSLKRMYTHDGDTQLFELQVDYSIFKDKNYGKIKPVQTARGCRYACDFCSVSAFYGNSITQRPIRDVIAEIEALEAKYIFLVDDNLFSDTERTKELLTALIPLNINWISQMSMDIAQDRDLMDLLAISGCITAVIGFESLNGDNLKQMKKSANLQYGEYSSAIRSFHDRGIMIYATFVFGYDQDTADCFAPVVDFALGAKFCLANFIPLTPTPGTTLYQRLQKEKRLLHEKWWLDPSYRYGDATFRPAAMTPFELTKGCFEAKKAFNAYSSILARALNAKANSRSFSRLALYFLVNYVSRKEILTKQGSVLGMQPLSFPKTTNNANCPD